jgi:hypothetical protein
MLLLLVAAAVHRKIVLLAQAAVLAVFCLEPFLRLHLEHTQ